MRMTWLADVLRSAGLTVTETNGWKTRGKDGMRPRVVIAHHTATLPTTPDSVVTSLLIQGRGDLPGPLCHLGLNRQGHYIVVAAGKANHAGMGAWLDANESVETIGIEAYNYGNGVPFPSREPWPQVQLDAYDQGVAALLNHIGKDERALCAHREWATPPGRKPDPSGIDMGQMRARVGKLLREDETMIVQPGATGPYVKPYQQALDTWAAEQAVPNWTTLAKPDGTYDGIYGPNTTAAVTRYQSAAGIGSIVPQPGALDDLTRDLLERFVE